MQPVFTAGPLNLGLPEILVIGAVAVLLFGGKKIGDLGKGLGEGIRNFKEAMKEEKEQKAQAVAEEREQRDQATVEAKK